MRWSLEVPVDGNEYEHEITMAARRSILSVGVCPLCQGKLCKQDIRPLGFDCPHCFKALKPCYFSGYLWVRGLGSVGAGLIWAWHNGWTGSFVIFVLGFYALPVMLFWDLFVFEFLRPKKIEPAAPSSSFLTLGLNS